jgi:hypothetical protein
VESGSKGEETADTAVHLDGALIRAADGSDEPEEGRLARAVPSHHSDSPSAGNPEVNMPKAPKSFRGQEVAETPQERFVNRARGIQMVAPEALSDVPDYHHLRHYSSSTK